MTLGSSACLMLNSTTGVLSQCYWADWWKTCNLWNCQDVIWRQL